MKWVSPLALIAVAALINACIPIPPHHSPLSRGNVPEEIPGWLEPGSTTLTDTFFGLGEPDDHSPDGRTLGWVNINRLGGGLLFFAAGGGAAAAGAMGERYRRLVVVFDGNYVVTDRSLESAACISGMWGVNNTSEEFGGHCLPPLSDGGSRPGKGQ
jgi:hypothetical protein